MEVTNIGIPRNTSLVPRADKPPVTNEGNYLRKCHSIIMNTVNPTCSPSEYH